MPTPRTHAFAHALMLTTLAAPALARDVAAAKELFNQGVAEMEAGELEKACPAIEASYKLDPRAGTLFTLAECEVLRGRLATAAARYDDFLSLSSRLPPDQQRKQADRAQIARDERAALAPQVPMLTLTLSPDAPRETIIKRDGIELVAAMLGIGGETVDEHVGG